MVIGFYSFFGGAPANELDWLFTDKGRLCLLLVALGIGFWPDLSDWIKRQIRIVRPVSKKRLRSQTLKVVAEMRDLLDQQEPADLKALREHQAARQLQRVATSEDERRKLREAQREALIVESDRDRRDLGRRFGGPVDYLLGEYERREALLAEDASDIRWMAESYGWLPDAANRLEALARRL